MIYNRIYFHDCVQQKYWSKSTIDGFEFFISQCLECVVVLNLSKSGHWKQWVSV